MRQTSHDSPSNDLKRAGDLIIFAHVVQSGGIDRCAKRMGLGRSTVSRRVGELERSIGVPLLSRSGRYLTPTESGRECFDRAVSLIRLLNGQCVRRAGGETSSLRYRKAATVVAPAEILDAQLGTLLREFERIRGCEIEVIPTSVGGRSVDATAPADMAIAWRPSRDSAALSTRLIDVERATYASPAYIEDRGLPSTPAEVKTHSCLSCANDDQFATWRYSKGAKLIRVRVRTTSPFADTAALRGATLAGAGIARLPKFLADQFIRCGRLVEILPEYTTSTCPLYAISSAEGNDPLMVAALRLFLEERLNLAS